MASRSAATKDSNDTSVALLESYIERFGADEQKRIRAIRSALRKRLPAANELVYDYKKFIVISYSPSEHGIEGIVGFAARSDGMRLYLMNGPKLPDPKKLLSGTGKQARFLVLEDAKHLAHPDVEALISAAIAQSKVPLPSKGAGKLVMKSEPSKPAPRKKTAKTASKKKSAK